MKSIAESMHNFDRENFQRVAAGLPEMQDEQALKRQAAKTAEIFNELFRQLLAVFPVLANKSVEDLNEMRRQWLLAFRRMGSPRWSRLTPECVLPANRKNPSCRRRDSSSPGVVLRRR